MRFTINTKAFVDAVKSVSRAIDKRGNIPILSSVNIVCDNDGIILTASDTITTLQKKLKCESIYSIVGHVTAAIESLNLILKGLNKETCEVSFVDDILKIDNFTVRTYDDYLDIPCGFMKHCSISAANLKYGVKRVEYATADSDEARRALQGIYAVITEKTVEFQATDRRRMAIQRVDLSTEAGENKEVLFPSSVAKFAKDLQGEVDIDFNFSADGYARLWDGNGNIQIYKLINNKFPDYKTVAPESFEYSYKFNRKELLDAITFLAPICKRKNGFDYLTFFFNGHLAIVTHDDDRNEFKREVKFENSVLGFPTCYMSYNPEFLIDMLQATNSKEVFFARNRSANGMVYLTDDDLFFQYYLMPVRLTDADRGYADDQLASMNVEDGNMNVSEESENAPETAEEP